MVEIPAARLFQIAATWVSRIGYWGLVGAAAISSIPAFFVFMMSFDGGIGDGRAWLMRAGILLIPGLLASVPLSAIYLLKRFPAFYPIGAACAVLLWGALAYAYRQHEIAANPGSFAAATANPVVKVIVGNSVYAVPEDFLGQAVRHPEQPQGILTIHVRYPDLAPVGNTSGKCEHKIALSDEKCPYFSIFIEPDDEHLPKDYDGLIRNLSLKSAGTEDGFEVFPYVAGKVYRWTVDSAERTMACTDLTCETWGRTRNGGAYRIVFSNSWWRDGKRLYEASGALVEGFRLSTQLRK